MNDQTPKVFISYSHDTQEHKDWVHQLASRLVANGVDVILDQWNLSLGGDLPKFIESGLTDAKRVLAICTESYVNKANTGKGGVGYEKMILTAQLMQDLSTEKIIPVIRNNSLGTVLPVFLGTRVYIDFRNDQEYEQKYAELVHEIYGKKIRPRPPLGKNPFDESQVFNSPRLSMSPERYVSPAFSGKVTFDFSNNNGQYTLGTGNMTFVTRWSRGSNNSIHVYSDHQSIRSVAIAYGTKEINEIVDASVYDTSSRNRAPHLGEIIVLQNSAGYYAAIKINELKSRSHGHDFDEISFQYLIQQDRTSSFKEENC